MTYFGKFPPGLYWNHYIALIYSAKVTLAGILYHDVANYTDKFCVSVATYSYCGILHQRSFGDTTVGRKTARRSVTQAAGLV